MMKFSKDQLIVHWHNLVSTFFLGFLKSGTIKENGLCLAKMERFHEVMCNQSQLCCPVFLFLLS